MTVAAEGLYRYPCLDTRRHSVRSAWFHTLIFCSVSDISRGSRDNQPASQSTLSEDMCLSPKPSISINQFGAAYNAPEMPDLVWPLPEFGSPFNAIPAADFAWLFSSRLPTAQMGGSSDTSPNEAVSGISPTVRPEDKGGKGRVVKVTWWRPHGRTAIAPGKGASETMVLGAWVLGCLGAYGYRAQAHDVESSTR